MCFMCDGGTAAEYYALIDRCIDGGVWFVQGVESDPPWAYTIGLVELFGHPELVMVGGGWEGARAVLNRVGERIGRGERVDWGSTMLELEDGTQLCFVPVARELYESEWFAGWWHYYGSKPWAPPAFAAMQVLLVDESWPNDSDPHSSARVSERLDRPPRRVRRAAHRGGNHLRGRHRRG